MAERNVSIPVWNSKSGSWEPVDFRNGQRVVEWPDGFNPQLLPIPEYIEGDRVQFIRDETCAREGTIRLILFQGNIAHFQEGQSISQQSPSPDTDDIIYVVTARGHDHRIKASYILGRFISLERISHILPPQE